MPESFTQEDIDAATAAAVATLQTRLSELETQVQETEVGRAVAEVTAAKNTEISTLQEQLDAATAARTAAESKFGESEQFWTDAIAAHQAAVEVAARKTERIAEATAAGVFDEKYISDNADRFAAMSAEDFQARLDEWQLIAAQTGAPKSTPVPARTALVASSATQTAPASELGVLGDMRASRFDPHTLHGGVR